MKVVVSNDRLESEAWPAATVSGSARHSRILHLEFEFVFIIFLSFLLFLLSVIFLFITV